MYWLRFSLTSWFPRFSGSFHYTQNAKYLDEIWMSRKIWIFLTSSDFWKNVFTVTLHVSSHAIKPLFSSTRNYDVTTKKEFGIETCKVHLKGKKKKVQESWACSTGRIVRSSLGGGGQSCAGSSLWLTGFLWQHVGLLSSCDGQDSLVIVCGL